MDDHTAATGGAESLDSVVRKYSTIWIWSILCATAGARLIGLGASVLMVSTPLSKLLAMPQAGPGLQHTIARKSSTSLPKI